MEQNGAPVASVSPAVSPIRRLNLLALIDATKQPQIYGHPTIFQTDAEIVPVLMKDKRADMNAPRSALMKRLEEFATQDWLMVLRESGE